MKLFPNCGFSLSWVLLISVATGLLVLGSIYSRPLPMSDAEAQQIVRRRFPAAVLHSTVAHQDHEFGRQYWTIRFTCPPLENLNQVTVDARSRAILTLQRWPSGANETVVGAAATNRAQLLQVLSESIEGSAGSRLRRRGNP